MNKLLPILLACTLGACESVRTVYDANGNVVEEREPGGERDLSAHFQKQFGESFSEQKGASGVPQTISNRRSSFQKDIDEARRNDKEYATKAFGDVRRNDALSKAFSGSGKAYEGSGRYLDRKMSAMASTDMTPDFMNETHGISHSSRYSGADRRSTAEGSSLPGGDRRFATQSSRYDKAGGDGYIDSRRDKTPEPEITHYRDFQQKTIDETKDFIHRHRDKD